MLEVRLYGRRAGVLRRAGRGRLAFTYDAAYRDDPDAPALSASMPLAERAYEHARAGPWFDGLLPEGARRAHLARALEDPRADTLALLEGAGGDCAGAVQVGPVGWVDAPGRVPLDEAALAALLGARHVEPIGSGHPGARSALAGVQEKAALCREGDGTWSLPVGGAPSTHIVKPETGAYAGVADNERWCMTIAQRAGLGAAPTRVETLGGVRALVAERFDRRAGARIHQEDVGQALARTQKYQGDGGPSAYDYFTVPGAARDALLDHMLFHWLIGNCDAHAKNTALLEPGTPKARLAPLYDVVSTECYPELSQALATSIGRARYLKEVDRRALEAMGRRIGLAPGAASARAHALAERVRRAVEGSKTIGPASGPVDTDAILARCERACAWNRQ